MADFTLELTKREIEVIKLLAEGERNNAIALLLGIGEKTVEFHLKNIYQKLGVTNRTGAVRKYNVAGNQVLSSTPR